MKHFSLHENVTLLHEFDVGQHTLLIKSDGGIELLASGELSTSFVHSVLLDSDETYRLFISLQAYFKRMNTIMSSLPEEYYAIANEPLEVPSEGSIHNASGFCFLPSCPCHGDKGLIAALNEHVEHGLASPGDATRIYKGQTIW